MAKVGVMGLAMATETQGGEVMDSDLEQATEATSTLNLLIINLAAWALLRDKKPFNNPRTGVKNAYKDGSGYGSGCGDGVWDGDGTGRGDGGYQVCKSQ